MWGGKDNGERESEGEGGREVVTCDTHDCMYVRTYDQFIVRF